MEFFSDTGYWLHGRATVIRTRTTSPTLVAEVNREDSDLREPSRSTLETRPNGKKQERSLRRDYDCFGSLGKCQVLWERSPELRIAAARRRIERPDGDYKLRALERIAMPGQD
jgi:hypothetical protein